MNQPARHFSQSALDKIAAAVADDYPEPHMAAPTGYVPRAITTDSCVERALAQADRGKRDNLRGMYPLVARVLAMEVRRLRAQICSAQRDEETRL